MSLLYKQPIYTHIKINKMYHIYSQIVILKITVALTILYANLRRNVIHVQLSHNMIQYNTICFFLLKQKCQFILLFWEWEINTGWWPCLLCYESDDYFKMTGVWPACTEFTFYCLSLTFTFLGNNIYIRSAVAVKTHHCYNFLKVVPYELTVEALWKFISAVFDLNQLHTQ